MKIQLRHGPSHPGSIYASDDRGSMPMALLVTLVGMSLSAILVPVVVNQIENRRFLAARTHALGVALAGIDAALGQLRAATTTETSGVGQRTKLPPCEMIGSEGVGGLRYHVTIVYHPDDANAATCLPTGVPVTATLTATGTVPLAGNSVTRIIETTYTFKTNNVVNRTGGALQLASPRARPLCMDGGGTQLEAKECVPGSSNQRFVYTADFNIKLVGSETDTPPAGMCLEAPLRLGDEVTLQPCLGRTEPRQQWSLSGRAFRGTYAGTSYCLTLHDAGQSGGWIYVDSCTSTALQRWSGSVNFTGPPAVTNIREK